MFFIKANDNFCLRAIKKNSWTIIHFKDRQFLQDKNLWFESIKKTPLVLSYVNSEFQNFDFFKQAISKLTREQINRLQINRPNDCWYKDFLQMQ